MFSAVCRSYVGELTRSMTSSFPRSPSDLIAPSRSVLTKVPTSETTLEKQRSWRAWSASQPSWVEMALRYARSTFSSCSILVRCSAGTRSMSRRRQCGDGGSKSGECVEPRDPSPRPTVSVPCVLVGERGKEQYDVRLPAVAELDYS